MTWPVDVPAPWADVLGQVRHGHDQFVQAFMNQPPSPDGPRAEPAEIGRRRAMPDPLTAADALIDFDAA